MGFRSIQCQQENSSYLETYIPSSDSGSTSYTTEEITCLLVVDPSSPWSKQRTEDWGWSLSRTFSRPQYPWMVWRTNPSSTYSSGRGRLGNFNYPKNVRMYPAMGDPFHRYKVESSSALLLLCHEVCCPHFLRNRYKIFNASTLNPPYVEWVRSKSTVKDRVSLAGVRGNLTSRLLQPSATVASDTSVKFQGDIQDNDNFLTRCMSQIYQE